jgi:chromosome segregation ATPase
VVIEVVEALQAAERLHERRVSDLKAAADTASEMVSRLSLKLNEAEAEIARLRAALETAERERDEARSEAADWRGVAEINGWRALTDDEKAEPFPWERGDHKGGK